MRILVVNPFGIGDVLFSLPLVQAIRRADPQGTLGYLCNQRTEALVACWGELDWHHCFEKDAFRAAWKRSKREGIQHLATLIREVRNQRFDILVDLSLGWQTGFAAMLAGIPKRIGFDFKGRGRFLTHRLTITSFHTQPIAEYYLNLLPLMGYQRPDKARIEMPLPQTAQSQAEARLEALGIEPEAALVAFIPGGGASWGENAVHKQWSPERFAQLGTWVAQEKNAQLLVLGDHSEQPLCQKITQAIPQGAAKPTEAASLVELAGLLKRCTLVIGNDSGPMHLAEALGVPSVSIFGPVDASVYGPIQDPHRHRSVALGLACQPCYQGFRFPPCPWNSQCLKGLEVGQVQEAIRACRG